MITKKVKTESQKKRSRKNPLHIEFDFDSQYKSKRQRQSWVERNWNKESTTFRNVNWISLVVRFRVWNSKSSKVSDLANAAWWKETKFNNRQRILLKKRQNTKIYDCIKVFFSPTSTRSEEKQQETSWIDGRKDRRVRLSSCQAGRLGRLFYVVDKFDRRCQNLLFNVCLRFFRVSVQERLGWEEEDRFLSSSL